MEDKLPSLDELNSETSQELPTLDDLNSVAKKKYTSLTIEIGFWYFKVNGNSICLRTPIYFKKD